MAQTVNRTFTNNYPQEYISQTRFNTEKNINNNSSSLSSLLGETEHMTSVHK